MTHSVPRNRARLSLMTATALVVLSGCAQPLDFDLRGGLGDFSTADAVTGAATAERPTPDARGVISYPNYQVAVAERGDTIETLAERLGVNAPELAKYNGVDANVPLRSGEVIALPKRVAEPSPATGAVGSGPIQPSGVDIGTLAGDAINRAPETQGVQTAALPPAKTAPQPQTGQEPTRHKVERGETAYTIARLYKVPVKSLAEWNGLGSDFAIREGQFLLIPVARQAAPTAATETASAAAVTQPGAGSPTPTPPSATKPLPEPESKVIAKAPPKVDVGAQTQAASSAAMVFPVNGSIIREYAKGKNEGINIKGKAGDAVKAADGGTVAAITKSADGIPIVVIRHDPELLTVYANLTDVSVEKGTRVTRGQSIAELREGDEAYVHFEVRKGFDSVDPIPFLK